MAAGVALEVVNGTMLATSVALIAAKAAEAWIDSHADRRAAGYQHPAPLGEAEALS